MALSHEQSGWLLEYLYIFKVHTLLYSAKFQHNFPAENEM
jgi:hypothetical protein